MKKRIKQTNLSAARGVDVSIITATLPEPDRPAEGLIRAYQSIIDQQGDYTFQWIIQIDGGEKERKSLEKNLGDINDDPRVSINENSRHLGQAITRNLALKSARGGAVIALDDDDEIGENAFPTWLEPLEKNEEIGWSAGQFVDATDEGYIEGRTGLPLGEIEKGELFYHWPSPERLFPLPPFCFALRTDLARKVGGWQGLPQGEDFGIVIAASCLAKGTVSDEITYIYHRHPGQMRFKDNFMDLESSVRNIVWDRAIALREDLDSKNRFR